MAIPRRFAALVVLFAVFGPQLGCVALNIPSERFGDPNDNGGLLGHWRRGGTSHIEPHHVDGVSGPVAEGHFDPQVHQGVTHRSLMMDGGPLEVDPFDPSLDVDGNRKQPEIPWPRFHPVPTRPVFAPATAFPRGNS